VGVIACLVILPDQLVCAVVDIACSIRAVVDGEDIPVVIIGIGKIITAGYYAIGGNLRRGAGQSGIVRRCSTIVKVLEKYKYIKRQRTALCLVFPFPFGEGGRA